MLDIDVERGNVEFFTHFFIHRKTRERVKHAFEKKITFVSDVNNVMTIFDFVYPKKILLQLISKRKNIKHLLH